MSKRIHELAKEYGVQAKDMLAAAEQLGLKGKRSQSTVTDDEAQRLKQALGISRPPQVTVGAERVVAERVVTQREAGADQLITSREQTTETRLQANVIRRRTAREVLKREELPGVPDGESTASVPPSLDFDDIPPPLDVPPPLDMPPPADVPPAVEATPVAATPRVEAPAPVAAPPPPPVQAKDSAPARAPEAPARRVETPEAAPPAPGFGEMRSVKVLGKIDLRKATPPPGAAPGGWRPAAPAGEAGAPASPGGDAARRKKGRKVIKKDDLAVMMERDAARQGKRPLKKKASPGKEVKKPEITVPRASKRIIRISEVISVADLAKAMGVKASEVLKKLIDMGMMATINQMLDHDTAVLVASEFEYQVENVAFDVEQTLEAEEEGAAGEQVPRAPVVTMMGHVDHGKTSLLDAIRSTDVAAGEAGGITQHIGAYTVDVRGRSVTFLDTPGHEAFTAMRARGAKVTDIVVLVVAADDGIMPQTVEAINHARAAEVAILVAVNKIDKPDANPERVKQELGNYGLAPEEWGGDTIVVPVSAKTKEGIPQLLDMLLLQADVLELKANPQRHAKGTIVEARLDRGRGPVATVLVQEGTLKVGDSFVCGVQYGRIRAMMDDKGRRIDDAGPSTPAEILGLGGVPDAGDVFVALQDDQKARQVAEHRRNKQREAEMAKTAKVSLDDLYQQIQSGDVKELKVVLKADVQGSVEALSDALGRLSTDDVRLAVIHGSVGGITESDVLLASASNAVVIGFNVRPEPKAAALAEREGVDVRLYSIIYEAMNELRDALEGLLEPTFQEKVLGRVEVRQTFTVSGIGVIAGCYVTDGKVTRGAKARLLRDNIVVHDGKIGSLRRFKDDAREVAAGYECGVGFENYQDLKVGDIIEPYEVEQVARRLAAPTKGAQAAERTA
jgi:translation initiation factor IF-2